MEAGGALAWWKSLTPREDNAGDRAALARLRRADNLLEAAAEPATIDLYDKLRGEHAFCRDERIIARDLPRAALVAAVLSNVRTNNPASRVANAIGAKRGGEETTALVTPLRFKRLVAARSLDDLMIAFRRLVAILDREAHVRDLARLLLAFTDPEPERADVARTIFAFHYHGAGNYAPDAEDFAANV
jgi:CRISPR system Cascade subunit CasB